MALKSNRNTRGSVNKGSTQNGIPSGITRTDNANISNDVMKIISTLGDKLLGEVRKLNETLSKSNAKVKQSENKDVKALANLVKKTAPDRKSAKNENNKNAIEKVNKMAIKSYLSESENYFDKLNKEMMKESKTLFKEGLKVFGNDFMQNEEWKAEFNALTTHYRKKFDELDEKSKSIKGYAKDEMSVMEKLQLQYDNEKKSLDSEAIKFFGNSFTANDNYKQELAILNKKYDKLFGEVSMKGITSYVQDTRTETQKTIDKYHKELDNLKKQGLATYGQDFEGSEAYQKELKALEQHYGQAIVDSKKKNNILLKGLNGVKGAVTNLPKDTQKSLKASFLGPLNLLLSPIQDFFGGGVGKLLLKVGGGIKNLFGKFTNKKPTANQVLKKGGQAGLGAVFITNTLKELLGKKDNLLNKFNPLTLLKPFFMLKGLIASKLLPKKEEESPKRLPLLKKKDKEGDSQKGLLNPFSGIQGVFSGVQGIFSNIQGIIDSIVRNVSIVGKAFSIKFSNKKPTVSQVLKLGGQSGIGAIYLGNILRTNQNDDKKASLFDMLKDKLQGMLGNIMKGMSSGLGGMMGKLGGLITNPVTWLVAGIVWMAIDAIRGIFKSKEWGTSKLAGGLGGALGGMDKGIKGAIKNMGKWALMGAFAGSVVFPVIGTIGGALIGGAIGMILGAIGGERLAKGFDKIGAWFKDKVWGGIKTFFGNIWQNITYVFGAIKEAFLTILNIDGLKKIGEAWKGDGSFVKKLGKSLGAFFMWVVGLPLRFLKAEHKILDKLIVQPFKQLFAKIKEVFSIQNILKVLTNIKDKIAEIGTAIWEGLTNIFSIENIKSVFNKGVKMVSIVGNFVKDFFGGFGESIKEALGEIKLVKWIKEKLIDPIFGVFEKIANIFGAIKTMGVKGLTSAFASGDFFGSISDRADALGRVKELNKQKQEGLLSDIEMQEYTNLMKEWKFKEKDVNDAIIKTDGTVIHTSPDDNIIATKNLPANVDTIRMGNASEMSRSLETDLGTTDNDDVISRLDKLVSLMGQFINKEPVKYTMPAQTRADLDLLIMGGAL